MTKQVINSCLIEGTGKGVWHVLYTQESRGLHKQTFKTKREAVSFAKSIRHAPAPLRPAMRSFHAPGSLNRTDTQFLSSLADSLKRPSKKQEKHRARTKDQRGKFSSNWQL